MPRISREASASWKASRADDAERHHRWPTPIAPDPAPVIPWGTSLRGDDQHAAPWAKAHPADPEPILPWGTRTPSNTDDARAPWVIARRSDLARQIDAFSAPALALEADAWAPWGRFHQADTLQRVCGVDVASVPADMAFDAFWRAALQGDVLTWIPWAKGRRVEGGVIVIIDPPDPETPVDGAIIIPVRKAYIVINSASIRRVSNNLPLPASALSVSIDFQSAHWSWSATMPLSALSNLERDQPGVPVELEATINGTVWRLAVERKDEDERFGGGLLSVGGRGIAAELSDPVYPIVQHDNVANAANARQLAEQALSFNGVSLGWSLDWQAADWLIPAGAWLFSGTPMAAVARLAEAAGAYVQSAPDTRTLRVLPRYPVKPWEWGSAAAGAVLPAEATLVRGASHQDKPGYNLVVVRGETGGIEGRVKRAGTAGDRPAPMIVDPLATHMDAITGRGIAVLGDTGPQVITRLETGVLTAGGVIPVGTLLSFTRGASSQMGLVRGLSVSATAARGRSPTVVRQTLEVEFHG